MLRDTRPMLPLMAALAALSVACPARKPPVVRPPNGQGGDQPPTPDASEEAAARALAEDARKLNTLGKTEEANKQLDRLVDTYAGTEAGAAEVYKRARAAEKEGNASHAIELYETLLYRRPTFTDAERARERYANLLLRVERLEDAASQLQFLYDSATDDAYRIRVGGPLARALDLSGKHREALDLYVRLHSTPGVGADLRMEIDDRASVLATSVDFQEARALWRKVKGNEDWEFILPALAYKLAKIYYHTRDYEESEEMLRLVAQRWPSHELGGQARDFLTRLQARFEVSPQVVGIVLPLSGRYQQYGSRALAAIKMALPEGNGVDLVVKDTAGDPTVAAKAVEDLVMVDHAIAIIGPLFSNEALAAALKAEELNIPIISLSYREGLPELGPWVFRTALTTKAQAQALADLAFDELGMSRFALLYPRSRYGKELAFAFWDAVNERKGEIRAAESYELNQKTFQEPVKKLVGRYYKYSRGDYIVFKQKLRSRRLPPHKAKMLEERFIKKLPPIIDFDAIIIPDSGRTIGLIAPAIAVEDVVLTRNPRMLERIKKAMGRRNIKPTTLMGASTWNSKQTIDHCERDCDNALFVDAFYPDSPDPKVRDFVAGFRDQTGAEPSLWEAQAFDTAGVVKWILAADKPRDRKKMRESMLGMTGFSGTTGQLRFDANGEVKRKLRTLTIEKVDGERAIRAWDRKDRPEG